MNTSILINANRDGKTVKKTVTNINPDKSNADLKTFAQMVNNLSNDTFAGGNRINVQSLDEEDYSPPAEPVTEKLTPTFAAQGNWVFNDIFAYRIINYNGDGTIYLQSDNGSGSVSWNGSAWQLEFINTVSDGSTVDSAAQLTFTINLYATEGSNYKAATLQLHHDAES